VDRFAITVSITDGKAYVVLADDQARDDAPSLQPSLGVSSQTWAALRGGSFSGSPIHVPDGEMADAARLPEPCCTALLRGPPPWLRGLQPHRSAAVQDVATGGVPALPEALRMVPEKITALIDAQILIAASVLSGRPDLALGRVVALYRERVSDNEQRLTS
jgi:hypothetical protein